MAAAKAYATQSAETPLAPYSFERSSIGPPFPCPRQAWNRSARHAFIA
jgi:hypothetical protein